MPLSATRVNLELLGGAALLRPDQTPLRLERKTAALLAYLALEGATPRSVIAGLLWPDSLETTARGNLRQLLRRLREGADADLIAGDDPLFLTDEVSVDAVLLELNAFAGDDAAVIAGGRELLEGLDFEDCADLTDWLLAKRESLRGLQVAALERLTDADERSGDFRAALLRAEKLLELDAVSEVAHRRVMRLHYLSGDRGAALRAYQRCCEVMQRELGVAPLPETTALAGSIEAGQRLESPVQMRIGLPLSVQRPPLLVGRLREWATLESAWDAGLGIAVGGEAGVGKSRLTLEFIASKGQYALVQGRPGDAGVPYSTLARSLRQVFADHPALELAPWVRLELSRLIPSLTTDTPSAISSEEGKLRFFESVAAVFTPLIETGLVALMLEDVQFADAASLEVAQYLTTRFGAASLRSLSTFRPSELPPEARALIQQRVTAGQVALVELQPLEAASMQALLDGLGLALPAGLAGALSRHSGGNPLFALETLRSLIERGDLTRDLPARLPVPKRLEALIAGRLERLTPGAQRLARTAAVAGADFSLELAASVLGANVLDLSEALIELEVAQVMRGVHFAHDLLSEAAFNTVPAPIRTVLHGRIAQHLETISAQPALIAHHWLEAGSEVNATPHWLEAARLAQANFRLQEAADALGRAANGLETQGQAEVAFETRTELHSLLVNFDNGPRHEAVIEKLVETARTPSQHVKAWVAKATLSLIHGRIAQAGEAANKSAQCARDAELETLEIEPLNILGIVFRRQGKLSEALAALLRSRQLCERHGITIPLAAILSNLGLVLQQLIRHPEASECFRQAAILQHDLPTKARVLNNLAMCLSSVGRVHEAIETLHQAQQLLEQTQGAVNAQLVVLNSLGNHFRKLSRYTQALESLGQALALIGSNHHVKLEDLYRTFSRIYSSLGAYDQAQAWLEKAFEQLQDRPEAQGRAWLSQARLLSEQGQNPSEALERAQRTLEVEQELLGLNELALEQSRTLDPQAACGRLRVVLKSAMDHGLGGLEITAHTRLAQTLLTLQLNQEALQHTSRALVLLEDFEPESSRAETLLAHHQALKANGHPEMHAHLERTLAWLLETADHHVPPEFRESFLNRNPINRAILAAATQSGLEVH